MYIAEKDLESGEKQQPHPDCNEQFSIACEMLLKLDVCAHLLSAPSLLRYLTCERNSACPLTPSSTLNPKQQQKLNLKLSQPPHPGPLPEGEGCCYLPLSTESM